MGLSGGKKCIQYLMFIFNFLFFLMGAAILGLGIWMKVAKGDYADISQKYSFLTAANIAIAAGIIILIVSFLGCCGAIKEVKCMLLLFFIFMLLIFILEIVAGGLAYAKRGDVEDKIEDELKNAVLKDYGESGEDGITKAIDAFQKNFKCCGYNNYKDYMASAYVTRTGILPGSCCNPDRKDGLKCPTDDPSIRDQVYFAEGCTPEVKKFLKDNLLLIGGFTIAFAIVQILGMIFSMMLYCAIRDSGTLA